MTIRASKTGCLTIADIQYNLDILLGKAEYPSSMSGERRKISPTDINEIALEFLDIFSKQVKDIERKKGAEKPMIIQLKANIATVTEYAQKAIKQHNPHTLVIASEKRSRPPVQPTVQNPPLIPQEPVKTTDVKLAPSANLSPASGPLKKVTPPAESTASVTSDSRLTPNSLASPANPQEEHTSQNVEAQPRLVPHPVVNHSVKPNEPEGLCGIPNRGNTCFMNAAFQMIMNDPAVSGEILMAYIDEKERIDRKEKPLHKKEQLTEDEYANVCTTMVKAIQAYGEGKKDDINLDPLRVLLRSRGAQNNGLQAGSEGDAEEFFYVLVEPILNSALIGSDQSTEYTCQRYVPSNAADAKKYSLSMLPEQNRRTKLINGRLKSNQTNFDSIIRLDPTKNAQGQALLNTLLGGSKPHAGEPIPCEDGWYVPVTERLILDPSPQRFIASIKRFQPTLEGIVKNEDSVHMPENLNIGDHRYQLTSIALHVPGHYKAYVKKNNSWYTANDSVISPTSREALQTAQEKGYLYFYEKIQ